MLSEPRGWMGWFELVLVFSTTPSFPAPFRAGHVAIVLSTRKAAGDILIKPSLPARCGARTWLHNHVHRANGFCCWIRSSGTHNCFSDNPCNRHRTSIRVATSPSHIVLATVFWRAIPYSVSCDVALRRGGRAQGRGLRTNQPLRIPWYITSRSAADVDEVHNNSYHASGRLSQGIASPPITDFTTALSIPPS